MLRQDHVVSAMKTFRPDPVLCALRQGDLGTELAWPLSWKILCLCLNVSAQMSGVWSWGGLLWVTVLFSEWGSMALPGVSAVVGLLVFSSARFTFPGAPRDFSGGITSNYSNIPAHSGWVGRQVHLVNWFQGTGIDRQKVNGQQVRCSAVISSSRLSPWKRTELPLVFQPSSPVFSTPQRDKKDRACQNQGSVFNSSMSFQTRKKNHTEWKWEQERPNFSGTLVGRGDGPYTSF